MHCQAINITSESAASGCFLGVRLVPLPLLRRRGGHGQVISQGQLQFPLMTEKFE